MSLALPSTMLAFQFDPARPEAHPIQATVPVPADLGPDEVLLKINAAGLCHSDLHLYDSPVIKTLFPKGFTLGHEGCGTAVKLGSAVKDIEIGTMYAVHSTNPCRNPDPNVCLGCSKGRDTLCVHPSRTWLGLGVDGSWAEYLRCPAQSLVKVPQGVSAEVAAVATDAVLTPWHAVTLRGAMQKGETVLVIGLGGLGLNCVEVCKFKGAGTIIAADVKPDTFDEALKKGAKFAVKSSELAAFVKEKGLNVDVVFDCVGLQATFDLGVACVASGGRVVMVGLGAQAITFPLNPLALRELDIRCCFWGNKSELVEILDAIAKGEINPVVSTAKLSEVVDKFHALERGEVKGRIAFVP